MKTPIEPSEIRVGDLIRFEGTHPTRAHEWVAVDDRHIPSYSGTQSCGEIGNFFLLDRPEPAVELPTEPTLGWAAKRAVFPILGAWQRATDLSFVGKTTDGLCQWRASDVTSFTPATAVPTSALDELRKDLQVGRFNWHLAVLDFLAAVDEAQA